GDDFEDHPVLGLFVVGGIHQFCKIDRLNFNDTWFDVRNAAVGSHGYLLRKMCPLIRELTDAGGIRTRGGIWSRVQESTIARLTHSCTPRQSEAESRPMQEM